MTLQIISAALGGFAAWLLGRSVALIVKRNRLKNYLEVCLWIHFEGARDSQKWLTRVMSDTLKEGQVVDGAPLYTRDELDDLTSVREQSVELLTRREMVRLTKCFRTLWELEALFKGFCRRLREHQDTRQPLDHDSVVHLVKRARRINALIDLLPKQLKSLDDLPEDYAGRIGAEVLVPDPPVRKQGEAV
jgi:hypothetical protein